MRAFRDHALVAQMDRVLLRLGVAVRICECARIKKVSPKGLTFFLWLFYIRVHPAGFLPQNMSAIPRIPHTC